jgi:PAS domain-containing protein
MSAAHFGPRIGGNAGEALDPIGNVLGKADEYSIFTQDPDGTFLFRNAGAGRLYGYEPDEVVCKDDWAVLHPTEDVARSKPRVILDAAQWDGKWGVDGHADTHVVTKYALTVRREGGRTTAISYNASIYPDLAKKSSVWRRRHP